MEILSRSNPVVMILEDAHWIDPTSLEAFGRAVDLIATLRVLLIVTFREPPWNWGRPLRDSPHHQSAGAARCRYDDRPGCRRQAHPGEHPAGHHRAHGRHPPVCGGDDQGGAGGRENEDEAAAHCGRCSVPCTGRSRKPSRLC